jgi:hypothetical protein
MTLMMAVFVLQILTQLVLIVWGPVLPVLPRTILGIIQVLRTAEVEIAAMAVKVVIAVVFVMGPSPPGIKTVMERDGVEVQLHPRSVQRQQVMYGGVVI